MKNKIAFFICAALLLCLPIILSKSQQNCFASDGDYYKIYDAENEGSVLFTRGDSVALGDEYISCDNKLYVIEDVNEDDMTGSARYKENVKMPVFNVKRKLSDLQEVNASSKKTIALYHTHNDECYIDPDGTDSVYGKGGIHDVGAALKTKFENLGINVAYSDNIHLPHNSAAYDRSGQTASKLISEYGPDGIFDIHRDATPRSEYITTVNGLDMSKVRMVVGSANQNSNINKEFALCIKSYADEVYPGLIKDIYIGKGNYNQQLSERAMLFEMGCHLIEKDLVLASCDPLSKTIDIVLYGTRQASSESLKDVDTSEAAELLLSGLARTNSFGAIEVSTPGELDTLWIALGVLGAVFVVALLFYSFNKKTRHAVNRFFSELTAGIFSKRKKHKTSKE